MKYVSSLFLWMVRVNLVKLMKAGIVIVRRHYRRLEGDVGNRVDGVLSALEGYAEQCLQGQVPLPFGCSTSPAFMDPININGWGPSALDWAGWDWNDLSHLFENSE